MQRVVAACGAKLRFAVVPEASVPKAFELWGIQFDNQATEQEKLCVLDRSLLNESIVEIQRIARRLRLFVGSAILIARLAREFRICNGPY
jgi:hypothetical protein